MFPIITIKWCVFCAFYELGVIIVCDEVFGDAGFDVSGITSVKVSAVNCLGQRATVQVFEMKINLLLIKYTSFITLQVPIERDRNHVPGEFPFIP